MNGLRHQETYDHTPIIHLFNTVIHHALEQRASDVHIEPQLNAGVIRLRVDGLLYEFQRLESGIVQQLIARIKVIANLDIAQSRIPQDGKFRLAHAGQSIDFRVSTFPCLYGENMVVRILDRNSQMIALEALGLSSSMQQTLIDLINHEQGFLLISGPTGSGKTTTLYALLSHLNNPKNHIITLEDPVEYSLHGVTQAHIFPEAGFTFAKGMRSLLRQDPDVIMVGEIRDIETAQIALEASLTGHMVMSCVHAHDATGVVMRLIEMGIEPFLINASLTGVLAQRLVRKICDACKMNYQPSDDERAFLAKYKYDNLALHKGFGCTACRGTGYKGRIGIFQLLTITSGMRMILINSPQIDDMHAQALRDGMQPLIMDGLEKVACGLITINDLLQVIGA